MTVNGSSRAKEEPDPDLDEAVNHSIAAAYSEVPATRVNRWVKVMVSAVIAVLIALSFLAVRSQRQLNRIQACQVQDSASRADLAKQDRLSVDRGFKIQDRIFADLNMALFDIKAAPEVRAEEFRSAFAQYDKDRKTYLAARAETEKKRDNLPTVAACSR